MLDIVKVDPNQLFEDAELLSVSLVDSLLRPALSLKSFFIVVMLSVEL